MKRGEYIVGCRSFKDVIERDYYNDIFDALSEYIERHADRLDLSTYRVENPEYAEISDIDVKSVRIRDKGGFAIEFDVIASAEITVSEHYHSDVETDEREQWFLLTCSGELEDGLRKFRIEDISLYSRLRYEKDGRMTESLVPVISKERFDDEAAAFLEAYFPEALMMPMPLPVKEAAARMGLAIKRISLTRDLTLFGMTVFSDTRIQCYDHAEQMLRFLDVGKGTILVDPNARFMRNIGSERNTIIHECVHWHKHRKYHELAKMYDPDAKLVACRVSEKKQGTRWGDEDWMAWQANGIAPRILMPKGMAMLKAEEYRSEYDEAFPKAHPLEATEYAIESLADFFGVSKAAAKIRMLDLGFREAAGLYVYAGDHYLRPFAFPEESSIEGHSYSIGIEDSFFEYFTNPAFQKYIDVGAFTYIDGHYVIDDPKYIRPTERGGSALTDYARGHFAKAWRIGLCRHKIAG